MEPLSTSLNSGGFHLRQIFRQGNVAVYEQSKAGKIQAYELVIIQLAKASEIMGKSYPEREVYPGNEQWGRNAWTISIKEDALERAKKLAATT